MTEQTNIRLLSLAYNDANPCHPAQRRREAYATTIMDLIGYTDLPVNRRIAHGPMANNARFKTDLESIAEEAKERDITWIQYHGHGGQQHPVGLQWNPENKGDSPNLHIKEIFDRTSKIRGLKVLVFNSCYSQGDLIPPPNTIVVSSSGADELSYGNEFATNVIIPTLARFSLPYVINTGAYKAWHDIELHKTRSVVKTGELADPFKFVRGHSLPKTRNKEMFATKLILGSTGKVYVHTLTKFEGDEPIPSSSPEELARNTLRKVIDLERETINTDEPWDVDNLYARKRNTIWLPGQKSIGEFFSDEIVSSNGRRRPELMGGVEEYTNVSLNEMIWLNGENQQFLSTRYRGSQNPREHQLEEFRLRHLLKDRGDGQRVDEFSQWPEEMRHQFFERNGFTYPVILRDREFRKPVIQTLNSPLGEVEKRWKSIDGQESLLDFGQPENPPLHLTSPPHETPAPFQFYDGPPINLTDGIIPPFEIDFQKIIRDLKRPKD